MPDQRFHFTPWRNFGLAAARIRVRDALPSDAAAIARIYNEGHHELIFLEKWLAPGEIRVVDGLARG